LKERIEATTFADASVPVYVNVSATPLTDGLALKDAVIKQLTAPVLWTATLERMWQDGVRSFTEIGPGKVLQGLVKRTAPDAIIDGIDTAADVERYGQARTP